MLVESVVTGSQVELRAVLDQDVPAVAKFLHVHGEDAGGQAAPDVWADAIMVRWSFEIPNRGFMLLHEGSVVGVYIAFYSERLIGDEIVRFCNLAAWYVIPEYRHHSVRLLKALLEQPGYLFTDLSPSAPVVKINRRFGFQSLDTSLITIRPGLQWPPLSRRATVTTANDDIEELLDGRDLEIYRDHMKGAGLLQLVVERDGHYCHLIFRKAKPGRIRKLPFVRLLYASNSDLFQQESRRVASHLLLRHGAAEIRAELRLLGDRPFRRAKLRPARQERMFKSPLVKPGQVDYLYSGISHFYGLFNGSESVYGENSSS